MDKYKKKTMEFGTGTMKKSFQGRVLFSSDFIFYRDKWLLSDSILSSRDKCITARQKIKPIRRIQFELYETFLGKRNVINFSEK